MHHTGIVILNYNTFFETIECVNSIMMNSDPENLFFCIVDNCSKDKSGEKLQDYFLGTKNVDVLLSPINLGFSGGNNLGIKKVIEKGCHSIFLLNSDIVVCNDIITPINVILQRGDAVVVGPSVYDANKHYTQYAKKGLTFLSFLFDKKILRSFFPRISMKLRYYSYENDSLFLFPGMVSGCCFAVTTEFISSIDLLDDKVFLYYEEDILAHIIKSRGLMTAICPEACVVHKEGVATKRVASDKMLLTRYYRWTSSLYVLKAYNRNSSAVCFFVAFSNMAIWTVFSLFKKNYRKMLRPFVKDNFRMLKGGDRR